MLVWRASLLCMLLLGVSAPAFAAPPLAPLGPSPASSWSKVEPLSLPAAFSLQTRVLGTQRAAFSVFSKNGLIEGFVALGALLALTPLAGGIVALVRGRGQVAWGLAGMICGGLAVTVGLFGLFLPLHIGFVVALASAGLLCAGLGLLNFTMGRTRLSKPSAPTAVARNLAPAAPFGRLFWGHLPSLARLSF